MPRLRATERHLASSPPQGDAWPPQGPALLDALMAIHHPARRRLYEVLTTGGDASVGRLARTTGLAAGSVSHHLKALHRAGFVEPVPGPTGDARQSWWRGIRRRLAWSTDDWPEGTAGRAIADVAEQANFEHHTRATLEWMRGRHELTLPWRELGHSTDNLVAATPEQVQALTARLAEVLRDWDIACREDAVARPDVERRPVRFVARIFPSDPGTP